LNYRQGQTSNKTASQKIQIREDDPVEMIHIFWFGLWFLWFCNNLH